MHLQELMIQYPSCFAVVLDPLSRDGSSNHPASDEVLKQVVMELDVFSIDFRRVLSFQ